jgi:signal peptidase II
MAGAIVLDRITKMQIQAMLAIGQSTHVVGPVSFTHVQNTGSVFGLGQGYVLIPTVATLVILALIPLVVRHLHVHHGYVLTRFEAGCIGLIAGGAVGNLVDRVWYSAVTDFIYVTLFRGFHWPAFNVADMCIVSGTILLLIAYFGHGASEVGHNVNA